ncbi:putative lipoprotein [Leptospira ryugenii]|uniref:Putative lipoprotein n=1 Tax=Leptospira ryugenii TaxID=1917863 RepID=A0A2P2E4P2_9LEPT|nr:putative lipoprotein [Leptospira ryugenii]
MPDVKGMADYDPYLFRFPNIQWLGIAYRLENEYGSLEYLIKKEISIRPERYPDLMKQGGSIQITKFQLASKDFCTNNQITIEMQANVQIGRAGQEAFQYIDQLETYVTDCFHLAMGIPILPLVWYGSYVGFRGNREDQLNQVGRNAIEAFFRFLEKKSGYQEVNLPAKAKAIPMEQPADPKLKPIMEEL